MTDEELTLAIAELQEVVRCRCDEAYRDRGLKDPHCECDSAEAVKIVARRIEQLAVTNEALTAKLAICEKYRDAYDEMGRIGTQAVRDLEAKLSKTEGLLAIAMHVIKGRIHWEASGLTCDCGECQALVATVAQIEGESHD